MTDQSAIVEENQVLDQDDIDDAEMDFDDDYGIEEPSDDDEGGEFKVPVIETIDEDDEPSVEKQPADNQKAGQSEKKPQPKTEEKPQEKQPSIYDTLIARAKKLGVTDDDIAMFGKSDQLERLCSLIEPNIEKSEASSEKSPEKAKEQSQGSGDEILLDPSVYDPNICRVVNSTASEISRLKTAVDNVVAVLNRQNQDSFERSFESMISSLGEEFESTLGKGGIEDIGRESQYFTNRCQLIDEMNAIAAGYAQTGKTVPEQKQLFRRALNSLFGDTIKAGAKKEIAAQLQKRSSQIISRPTGAKGKDTMTPDQRATTAVRDKLRQFGAYEDNETQEDF